MPENLSHIYNPQVSQPWASPSWQRSDSGGLIPQFQRPTLATVADLPPIGILGQIATSYPSTPTQSTPAVAGQPPIGPGFNLDPTTPSLPGAPTPYDVWKADTIPAPPAPPQTLSTSPDANQPPIGPGFTLDPTTPSLPGTPTPYDMWKDNLTTGTGTMPTPLPTWGPQVPGLTFEQANSLYAPKPMAGALAQIATDAALPFDQYDYDKRKRAGLLT